MRHRIERLEDAGGGSFLSQNRQKKLPPNMKAQTHPVGFGKPAYLQACFAGP